MKHEKFKSLEFIQSLQRWQRYQNVMYPLMTRLSITTEKETDQVHFFVEFMVHKHMPINDNISTDMLAHSSKDEFDIKHHIYYGQHERFGEGLFIMIYDRANYKDASHAMRNRQYTKCDFDKPIIF